MVEKNNDRLLTLCCIAKTLLKESSSLPLSAVHSQLIASSPRSSTTPIPMLSVSMEAARWCIFIKVVIPRTSCCISLEAALAWAMTSPLLLRTATREAKINLEHQRYGPISWLAIFSMAFWTSILPILSSPTGPR